MAQCHRIPERHLPRLFGLRAALGHYALVMIALAGIQGCNPDSTSNVPLEQVSSLEQSSVSPELDINGGAIKMTNASKALGLTFCDVPESPFEYDDTTIVGAGCALHDLDNDGIPEIFLLRIRHKDDSKPGNQPGAGLFKLGPNGLFVDTTAESGLAKCKGGAGVAIADCNNDAWPDLLITSPYDISLWLNDGTGKFNDITTQAGINHTGWAVSASWFDYNRDGLLDLFVSNYLEHRNQPCTSISGGKQDFCSPLLFEPTIDRLYRNVSQASQDEFGSEGFRVQFRDVTVESRVSTATSAGMGTLAADFTDDGWPDVYVASDQRPNRLWVNQKNGTFAEEAGLRGCNADFQGRMQASMGVALGTIQSPGKEILVTSNLSGEFHAVYSPVFNGFVDVSRQTGIGELTRPYTGFGVTLADFDCDGFSDLFTVNGRVSRANQEDQNDADFWAPYREPMQLLQNRAGVFHETHWGMADAAHVARGLAVGDLDADGDLDCLVSTIGEFAIVLRNDSTRAGNWIGLRAIDPELGGRSCPGAVFVIHCSSCTLRKTLQPCQSYASTNQDLVHLGLGTELHVKSIDVIWPHGDLVPERFEPLTTDGEFEVNHLHILSRGSGQGTDISR